MKLHNFESVFALQGYIMYVPCCHIWNLKKHKKSSLFCTRNAVNALQIFSASVKTKARDLRKEKRRAEGLVYQMLPKSVADSLRTNKTTSEMFDSATICFTEIDGFKNIARSCSPLQLFDLLNTIYKTFDARIDNNDVYKVETINDSYMVASGENFYTWFCNGMVDLTYSTLIVRGNIVPILFWWQFF